MKAASSLLGRWLAPSLLAGSCLLSPFSLAEDYAITGVTVLSMEGDGVLAGYTVLIEDGLIAGLGPDEEMTAGDQFTRIEGGMKFLVPGLTEMHAHIPGSRAPAEYLERVLLLFLANGVTTVRGMLGDPMHLELRAELADGRRLGPRLITSGPSFNGRSVSGAGQARAMAIAQSDAGYDFLKLHPGLELDEFEAIVAAAAEQGIPFAGHVSVAVGLGNALAGRQATIDHLDGYMAALVPAEDLPAPGEYGLFGAGLTGLVDRSRLTTVAADTARQGVANVATEALLVNLLSAEAPEDMLARPEYRYVDPATREAWSGRKRDLLGSAEYSAEQAEAYLTLRREILRSLHRAGGVLLLGSDAPQVFNVPGFSLHQELELMVAAGLTPREALLAGTRAPATFFGREKEFGVIRVGAVADLVLLDANPLEDISNTRRIAGVMRAGRWLSRQRLDRELAALAYD